jgi:acetolactate synthase-1/2/3 large subunit
MARGRTRILLADLAERTDLPIVFMESPRGTADPSLGAFSDVLPEADTVLLLGKKLDFSLKMGKAPLFKKDCRFLLVDYEQGVIDEARSIITEPACLEVAAIGSPLEAARKIFSEMPENSVVDRGWTEEVKSAIAYSPKSWDKGELLKDNGGVHPMAVGRSVRDFMIRQQDAIFVSDGGEFGQWAQAIISAPDRVINGPSGAIGGGVPFALGARCARPGSPIFLTSGDGSFGYHIMEVDTAVRYNFPFVAIVGNDATWNAEYQIQLRDYGEDRLIGCELLPTRYDLLVESLGGFGVHVTSISQLPLALEKALASGLPSCVNVEIQRAHAPTVSRLEK